MQAPSLPRISPTIVGSSRSRHDWHRRRLSLRFLHCHTVVVTQAGTIVAAHFSPPSLGPLVATGTTVVCRCVCAAHWCSTLWHQQDGAITAPPQLSLTVARSLYDWLAFVAAWPRARSRHSLLVSSSDKRTPAGCPRRLGGLMHARCVHGVLFACANIATQISSVNSVSLTHFLWGFGARCQSRSRRHRLHALAALDRIASGRVYVSFRGVHLFPHGVFRYYLLLREELRAPLARQLAPCGCDGVPEVTRNDLLSL